MTSAVASGVRSACCSTRPWTGTSATAIAVALKSVSTCCALGGVHQRQLGNPRLRLRHDPAQQRLEVIQQPLDRRRLEQVRVVLEQYGQAGLHFGYIQTQVELGGVGIDPPAPAFEVCKGQCCAHRMVQHE